MRVSWIMVLVGALFASPASATSTSGASLVRDLAFRVGPIAGAALVCRDIARSRLQIRSRLQVRSRLPVIVDKFHTLTWEAASREAERGDLAQVFDRSITDGTNQLAAGKSDCITAERRLSEFERSLGDQAFVTLALVENLAANLEAMNDFDPGIGSTPGFGRGEHQASHKIWGTALDEAGIYQPIEFE
jgi:hypothetical protein